MAQYGREEYLHYSIPELIYGQYINEEDRIIYDENKIFRIRQKNADYMLQTECKDCLIVYNCAGGCLGQSFNETGKIRGKTDWDCIVTKYLASRMPLNEGLYPVLKNEKLIPDSVYEKMSNWRGNIEKDSFLVTEIDSQYAGGIDLCKHYEIPVELGANCLVVEGKRAQQITYAVCLVPVGYKYNMSSVVRKAMNARTVSVAPLEMVLNMTGMEYGSITPIGIPDEWTIYVDPLVMQNERIIIGGGYVKSKLSILLAAFQEMPNVIILEGVAKKMEVIIQEPHVLKKAKS